MKPFKTVVEVLRYAEREYSLRDAFNYPNVEGGWITLSSEQFASEVKNIALGLNKLGLKKGDKVGILAPSSPRWMVVDCAIMASGCVTVPLFESISVENLEFELLQTHLKMIFIAGDAEWMMFNEESVSLDVVISLYPEVSAREATTYEEVCQMGKSLAQENPTLYESMRDRVHPDDLATIVYTSGSTGVPKGVMLTQHNLIGLAHLNPFNWKKERYVNVLPLAHIFARSVNFLMLARGVSVYYVRDIATFGKVCAEITPSVLVVVPRLLEKMYAKICMKVNSDTPLKRSIGRWAISLANRGKDSLLTKFLHCIADKFVYSKFREAIGGNVKTVICGGAALRPQLCQFLWAVGMPIYEGWGQTEAATISCSMPEKIIISRVGVPFEGMSVKVSEEGELLVKGSNVMKGYFMDEEGTRSAFTEDGWLRTGDSGTISEDGTITISGRIKEMYKTSTGEWLIPTPIEQQLSKAPLIDLAVVVGEGKKFISALFFPDFEMVKILKKKFKLEHLSDEKFLESSYVRRDMERMLSELNKHLNHWEAIRCYRFIVKKPTVSGGELTPSMKIRRDVIQKKYRHIIDSMYEEVAYE